MAGKIKGITIEIGGNTQPLNKSLEDVNKKSKSLQSELKQVEKLLKLDPKNTELLAQKQKLLAEAVQNSKEKLDRLKTAQAEVNEQFKKGEISEEQYRAFQREVVKAEQELDGFEKQLKDTAAASKSLGEKMKEAGEKMQSVGANMTKYVTVPLAAAGAGMVAVGKQFDDAFDKIRIGTGATGKALEGLNDDFRKVATQVPSSFDEVSTAIADYNTRLGISGQALQNLSVQTLNLARITDSDLGKTIEETSQSFQAFNVPVEKFGESLDYIFKVSQSTGITIDRLQQNLVKFAPALKQMGFDFYESAALMGFFDKTGVEVEQAMTGLNKALVNMAKDGVTDANEALQMLFEEIKGAPSDIKATELAIEIFGSKAGPLMASAIREGKLEYEALVQELMKSKETINGVADETDDWAEGLAKLKNQVMIATEPIAGKLFDALNGLIPLLEKAIVPLTKLAEGFGNLPQGMQVVILAVLGLVAALGPLLTIIGSIVIAAPGIAVGFTAIGGALAALTGPIGIVIAAVAALAAGVYLVINNWDKIKEFFSGLWDAVKNIFSSAWEAITNFLSGALQGIINLFMRYHPIGIVIRQWDEIKNAISSKINAAKDAVRNALDAIYSFFANLRLPEIKIPHIKLPHFSIQGEFDLRNFKVPSLGVDWYKTGGIFTSPSIIGVGEAGTEAVIPLDRLERMLARYLPPAQAAQPKEVNIEVNNYGPVGESSEGATTRALQKLQYMGVFG